MPPARLLIMRHAEKLEDPDDKDLSPDGQDRAKALAKYIPDTFGRIDFIVATAISRHSERPIETVHPLSKRIGVPIDSTFADNDYGALAKLLLNDAELAGKTGVVCWHHGNIPNMMNALHAPAGSYPDPWDRNAFNLILDVTFPAGAAPQVKQVTEPF